MRGRMVARAEEAPSRDALRGRVQVYEKPALDSAMPAPESGHTHEEHLHRVLALPVFARGDVAEALAPPTSTYRVSFFYEPRRGFKLDPFQGVFFRIKALDVLGGAFVRAIEHIPGRAVFQLDRAKLRFVRHSKLHTLGAGGGDQRLGSGTTLPQKSRDRRRRSVGVSYA